MTVDVSKQVAYAVLVSNEAAVSKQVAYAALVAQDVAVSKQVAYAVLFPGAVAVSKQVAYAVLLNPGTQQLRLPYIGAEPIVGGVPNVRLPFAFAEPLTGGNANVRLPYIGLEPLTGGNSAVRCPLIGLEVFYSLPEERPVATDILPTRSPIAAPLSTPGLPGLTWSVHKRPAFRTQVQSSESGVEIRTSRMQYPLYNYELKFEFLDNRGDKTQYDELAGFFMRMRGSWKAWLYQDPGQYELDEQFMGNADGGTTGFVVTQSLGGFTDPIGQFDLTDLFEFVEADVNVMTDTITVDAHNLPTGFGPLQLTTSGTLPGGLALLTNYWIISTGTNTLKLAATKANALANNPVAISDDGMGVFTAANSVDIVVNGTPVAPADYVVTEPNEIVFDTAPVTGAIGISCKYFFVCRFKEDEADFEEFMADLWSLQTLAFQSILSVT